MLWNFKLIKLKIKLSSKFLFTFFAFFDSDNITLLHAAIHTEALISARKYASLLNSVETLCIMRRIRPGIFRASQHA
jgi:hypothetical protein